MKKWIGAILMAAVPTMAWGLPEFVTDFQDTYPTATRLHNCGTCHESFTEGDARNVYGQAWESNAQDFAAIENLDSDGDGVLNAFEILETAGFHPAWTCETLGGAGDAPVDLADFVDPQNPGCVVVTTSTTTTTLPTECSCGDPRIDGLIMASDALWMLLHITGGIFECPIHCCDVDNNGNVVATDAVRTLERGASLPVVLTCPPPASTSTTATTTSSTSTTSTSSTSSTIPATTSTSISTTTTSSTTSTTGTTSTTLPLPTQMVVALVETLEPLGALQVHVDFSAWTGVSLDVSVGNVVTCTPTGAPNTLTAFGAPSATEVVLSYVNAEAGLDVVDNPLATCPMIIVPGSPVPDPADLVVTIQDFTDVNTLRFDPPPSVSVTVE